MIQSYLAYQFAGLWALIWHFGAAGALAIGCLAAAYFSPVFKKHFLWAAVCIVAVMVSTAIGVNLGEKRIQAQWDVAKQNSLNVGKKARADGVRDAARTSARKLPAHRDPDLRD
jgi:asparagine N-glycosylation enzyme membrane subunit Stt3